MKNTPNTNPLFTDSEYEHLILMAVEPGATKKQAKLFVKRCEQLRIQELMLKSILENNVKVVGYSKDDFIVKKR